MQVGILGPLNVTDGARPVEIGGARLRALLIRLAADAGSWVPVSELVEALWESDPPGDEINALQSLVSRLRRALPVADLIESGPAGYRLAVEPDAVDAIRFERLAGQGRRRLTDGAAEEALTLLGEAIGLWRGTPLTEVADARYALTWAERLEKLRLTAIENRAAAGLALGRHADLVADLEEVIAQHPLRERSHELLIRALAGTGRQAEALAVYDRLSRRLAEELGLDPPVHLQRLQTAVLQGDPALLEVEQPGPPPVWSPATPPARPRTNLRAPLTSFVGREAERLALFDVLGRSRLVTLVGPGGAGKTRLSAEVASGLANNRSLGGDGIWMAELAPVTDPEAVASAVLGSVGLPDRQILERGPAVARDAPSRLVDTVSDHRVVLILDNCEHVLDAAAKLAEYLLGQCPHLIIVATSREPLGIVGELLWPVHPLATPEAGVDERAVRSNPAVRLFVDRAALVRPGFELTERNLAAVAEICRRLDGLPLAIELAAARLRNLTVDAVAARLGNRFRLLTGGNRTAMPRHQTLRAVVAWSWDLLTGSERRLAGRLSVFPGGATVESAESICARSYLDRAEMDGDPLLDDSVPGDAVAELLVSLADKSLLSVVEPTERDDGAEPRYRMLETIREFAAEQLQERDEVTVLRRRHARYFLDLAETAEPKLRGAEQLSWLGRLDAEHDNLLAALRFAVESSDADTALRLGAALSWYWTLLGRHDQAATWLEQVLKVPGERPPEAYAITSVLYAITAALTGRGLPEAEEVDRVLELVRGLDLSGANPLLLLVEPAVMMLREDGEQVRLAIERNLVHADPWGRAMLNLMIGVQAENDGDFEAMQERIPLALSSFRAIGDRWGMGASVGTMANIYTLQGRLDEAIVAMEEARVLMAELQAGDDESYALSRIGLLRFRQGDLAGARAALEASVANAESHGSDAAGSTGLLGLAYLAHHEGRAVEARQLADSALRRVERATFAPPQIGAMVHSGLAVIDLAAGDLPAAAGHLAEAHRAVVVSGDMPIAAVTATCVAELALARGDAVAAAELLGVAVRLRGTEDLSDPDVKRVTAGVRAVIGTDFDRHHAAGRSLTRDAALALMETRIQGS